MDLTFQLAIMKLFSSVVIVSYFHEIWSRGPISHFFKSGDTLDPHDYRGICVITNLGKLFCSIIYSIVYKNYRMYH